MRGQLKPQSS